MNKDKEEINKNESVDKIKTETEQKDKENFESDILNKSFKFINFDVDEKNTDLETRKIGTRSQSGIIHTELETEKKLNKIKMATKPILIKLDEAVRLIPNCTGENDFYQFINACDLAINSVEQEYVPLLVKYIVTKLSGRALVVTKYRDTSKWINIKKLLLETFEAQYALTTLQMDLSSARMRSDENVASYSSRVEELYYKLCNASVMNKSEVEAAIIRNTIKEQALAVFLKGLREPLKIIIKSRNPDSLEQAMQMARSEERELESDKDVREYYNTNGYNRKNNNFNNNLNNYRNNANNNMQRWNNNINNSNNNYQHRNGNNRSNVNQGQNGNNFNRNNFSRNNNGNNNSNN